MFLTKLVLYFISKPEKKKEGIICEISINIWYFSFGTLVKHSFIAKS